jgi:hypothetical protein
MATKKNAIPTPPAKQVSSSTPDGKAKLSLFPAVNAAIVIDAFQDNVLGEGADITTMIYELRETFKAVRGGDLDTIEAMLISQATALQTIFTSLAKRATHQDQLHHYEAFLGLALKAQAQSRATISALVDLKYPRQATFVKQANIANGPQQVNNGAEQATHAKEIPNQKTELLEDQRDGSTQVDTRAAAAPVRSHPAVETVAAVHRAAKPRR